MIEKVELLVIRKFASGSDRSRDAGMMNLNVVCRRRQILVVVNLVVFQRLFSGLNFSDWFHVLLSVRGRFCDTRRMTMQCCSGTRVVCLVNQASNVLCSHMLPVWLSRWKKFLSLIASFCFPASNQCVLFSLWHQVSRRGRLVITLPWTRRGRRTPSFWLFAPVKVEIGPLLRLLSPVVRFVFYRSISCRRVGR